MLATAFEKLSYDSRILLRSTNTAVVMGIESPSFVAEQCDSYVMMERSFPDEEDKKPMPTKKSQEDSQEFLPYSGVKEEKKLDEMSKIKDCRL